MTPADGWDALEVRHLRALAAVVEAGSFAGAARELGYTQSAVSQQVLALERVVGAPVLHRHPGGRRPPELTEAGRTVLAHATAVLARVKAAQADVAALGVGEAGRVRVATIESFGARVLPPLLARLRALVPRVHVELAGGGAIGELFAAVESGDVDVCFAVLPLPEGPFEVRHLLDDPYALVVPAGGAERALTDLGGRRVLLSCSRERDLVEAHLLTRGVAPAAYVQLDDNGVILALVAAGEGAAVLPMLAVDPADARVEAHGLPELEPRRVVAVWHRDRHLGAAARLVVDAAADMCAARGDQPRLSLAAEA